MEILAIILTIIIFIFVLFLIGKIGESCAKDGFFKTWEKIKNFNL